MKLKDLNKEYDKLQEKYGEPTLNSIYNGGCEESPDICFIFMNPTGRNNAAYKDWKGLRSPWISTKNIWKLFYKINLLDKTIFNEIQKKKPKDWTEEFAQMVYDDVKKRKYFITNLGKCTQIDARPLKDEVYKEYLNLLFKEIEIIKPKIIITFGNQVSSIILNKKINVSKCRKEPYKQKIHTKTYNIFPTFYPIGNGMRNLDLVIEDINYIIKNELK